MVAYGLNVMAARARGARSHLRGLGTWISFAFRFAFIAIFIVVIVIIFVVSITWNIRSRRLNAGTCQNLSRASFVGVCLSPKFHVYFFASPLSAINLFLQVSSWNMLLG